MSRAKASSNIFSQGLNSGLCLKWLESFQCDCCSSPGPVLQTPNEGNLSRLVIRHSLLIVMSQLSRKGHCNQRLPNRFLCQGNPRCSHTLGRRQPPPPAPASPAPDNRSSYRKWLLSVMSLPGLVPHLYPRQLLRLASSNWVIYILACMAKWSGLMMACSIIASGVVSVLIGDGQ